RQVDPQTLGTQLRSILDNYQRPTSSPVELQPAASQESDGAKQGNMVVAVAAKPFEQPTALNHASVTLKLYLEPFQPARMSIIWSFNSLYWNALDAWETTFQKGYESSLPGGSTDACNPDFVAASVSRLCQTLDDLRCKEQLPDQIFVLEIGVGNGAQARSWLDRV